jgi:hypothetical protein
MIVWGGQIGSLPTNTGGRYDPEADTWIPTFAGGAPSARRSHRAVWIGDHMLVWGGMNGGTYFAEGVRYDPLFDAWQPIASTGAPAARADHELVWTGSRAIVWGGQNATSSLATGGVYDPLLDTWSSMSATNAPSPRIETGSAWTGSFLLVWGGSRSVVALGSGGRYALGHATDDDGDGMSECDGDCNDAEPGVTAPPSEVANLQWWSPSTLAWDPLPAARYDVMYGDLAGVSILTTGTGDTCLAVDLAATSLIDTSPVPAPDRGSYFLVRGGNVCGRSAWGYSSNGDERTTTACP